MMRGAYKRACVAYAKQARIPIPKGINYRDTYGGPARTLTQRIQAKSNIKADGNITPETLLIVGKYLPGPLAWRAATCMELVTGPLEVWGNNLGPYVQQIQRLGSELSPGAWPWCAAATSWAYRCAGWKSWAAFCKAEHEAWVPAWLAAARAGKYGMSIVTNPRLARRGDPITFDWNGGDGVPDHIGLIRRRPNPATLNVLTVEANTSPENVAGSQDDGGGMWLRTRNAAKPQLLIRIT
jgi:hypothetical protein